MDHVLLICEQLDVIGQPFKEQVIDGIVLGGLPKQFRPLILGIQDSKQETTVEFVKSLLQEENIKSLGDQAKQESTFYAAKTRQKNKANKGPCYSCGQYRHIKIDCSNTKRLQYKDKHYREEKDDGTHFAAKFAAVQSNATDAWFIDSGATTHLTYDSDWIKILRKVHLVSLEWLRE